MSNDGPFFTLPPKQPKRGELLFAWKELSLLLSEILALNQVMSKRVYFIAWMIVFASVAATVSAGSTFVAVYETKQKLELLRIELRYIEMTRKQMEQLCAERTESER